MRIEFPTLEQTTIGKRLLSIVQALGTASETVQRYYARGQQQSAPVPDAMTALQSVLNVGKQAARAVVPSGQAPLGHWKPLEAYHPTSERLESELRRDVGRYAKTATGLGIQPFSWGFTQTSEVTPTSIAAAHRRAITTGWLDTKTDVHTRWLCDDTHVGGVDQIRRSGFYRYPLRVAPRKGDTRPAAILLANAVRAALDELDGLSSALAETTGAMTGFGLAELVYATDRELSIPVGGGRSVLVPSEIVCEVAPISQRFAAFDVIDERPYLCYGPSEYVSITAPDLQKFLFIKGDGQASQPMRFRGWGWSIDWMCWLAGLDINKLGTVVETFGVPTPYLQRNDNGVVTPEEAADALQILTDIGLGRPAVIPPRMGKLEHSPVPSGLAPIHVQFLSVIRTEQSKRILSSTLQTQLDANGSWAAASIHEGQETKVSKVDCKLSAEALQTQLVRYLVDANAERWAAAFSRYVPGGVTPGQLRAIRLSVEFVITDESAVDRLKVYQGARGLGLPLDEEQIREETGLRPPTPKIETATEGTLNNAAATAGG